VLGLPEIQQLKLQTKEEKTLKEDEETIDCKRTTTSNEKSTKESQLTFTFRNLEVSGPAPSIQTTKKNNKNPSRGFLLKIKE